MGRGEDHRLRTWMSCKLTRIARIAKIAKTAKIENQSADPQLFLPAGPCLFGCVSAGVAPLQLKTDVDKIVWRPGARVLEIQTIAKLLGNAVHGSIKLGFALFLDKEGSVHNHLIADWLVVTGSYADRAQPVIDIPHVVGGQLSQRLVNHAAKLHPGEVGGLQMLAREFLMEAVNFIVLALEFFNDAVAVPGNFEPKLKLARHLAENVFKRRIDAFEDLFDVFAGAEDGAEGHGHDGVILHYRFDHVLVGQCVVTRWIENKNRSAAHHSGYITIMNGGNILTDAAYAALAKIHSGA